MSYTSELLNAQRWQGSINFGSPMTSWTSQMHRLYAECNGDKSEATRLLYESRKEVTS